MLCVFKKLRQIRLVVVAGLWVVPTPVPAQRASEYDRHALRLGGGLGMPLGATGDAGNINGYVRVAYAYRFHRNIETDLGLEWMYAPFSTTKTVRGIFDRKVAVYNSGYLLPLGVNYVQPLSGGRARFHAGGGGIYVVYTEGATENIGGFYPNLCGDVCQSRSGFGYSVNAGIEFEAPGGIQIGFTSRWVSAGVTGGPVGIVKSASTRDRWLLNAVHVGFTF